MRAASNGALSSNDSQQDNHDGNHQQYVNESAHGVRSNQPQQPQDEHYYSDGIKHDVDSLWLETVFFRTRNNRFVGTANENCLDTIS
jgi:hypothetical protein